MKWNETSEMTNLMSPDAAGEVTLREVADADIPILFEHQLDPEATEMAAFPARDWERFSAHWARIRADESVVNRVVLLDGVVAGNIGAFDQGGKRLVGYWVGREHWGKGVATRGLSAFLNLLPERPLHAYVAAHNVASRRVLEKCGFVVIEDDDPTPPEDGVEEVLLVLRS